MVKTVKEFEYYNKIKQLKDDLQFITKSLNNIIFLYDNCIIENDEVITEIVDSAINKFCEKCYNNFHND